jgi:hypothetical protein
MQPDNRVQSETGNQAEEFGRTSEDSPGPTKQDLSTVDLSKYDLLFIPNNIAIRCIGCMKYIWEHEYIPGIGNDTSLINEFMFNFLSNQIIEHRLECTFWNKNE